jgi:hypothetical protein
MASINGTYICGHNGVIRFQGSASKNEWRKKDFDYLCFECQKKEDNEKAEKFTKENNLIELEGTEKQIAWANTLRHELLTKFDKKIKQTNQDIKEIKNINLSNEEEKILLEIYSLNQEGKEILKNIKYEDNEIEITKLKTQLESIKLKIKDIKNLDILMNIYNDNAKYIQALSDLKDLEEQKNNILTVKSAKFFIDNRETPYKNYLSKFFSIING